MAHLSDRTDESLLESALAGYQDAWTELVDRLDPKAVARTRRQLNDLHAARDVVQNTWASFVTAVQRQFPHSVAALFWSLWKRRVIDELRKRGRNREAAWLDSSFHPDDPDAPTRADRLAGDSPDPAAEAERAEAQAVVRQALERLPDHYRLVLVARQMEERTNRETAALLIAEGLIADDGNVEKRVENYYYRGLKELKRQLEALGYVGGGGAA